MPLDLIGMLRKSGLPWVLRSHRSLLTYFWHIGRRNIRFIDIILVIWSGTEEQFNAFVCYMNDNDINMNFRANYGGSTVEF